MTFVGLDLAVARKSDYALLDEDVNCSFGECEDREDGSGLIPAGVDAEASVGRRDVLGNSRRRFVVFAPPPSGEGGTPCPLRGFLGDWGAVLGCGVGVR